MTSVLTFGFILFGAFGVVGLCVKAKSKCKSRESLKELSGAITRIRKSRVKL